MVRALKYPKSRHAILRFRFNHVKQSIWYDTWPKIIGLAFPEILPHMAENKSDWFIRFPNESEVWFGGLDDKTRVEKILGNEYATIYKNECSQISLESSNMASTRLAQKIEGCRLLGINDCNPPSKKHWTYEQFAADGAPENHGSLIMNPVDNLANLPPDYIKRLEVLPMRQRQRFLLGQFIDDIEGALWKQEWIDQNRLAKEPDLVRIVVAVDPAASKKGDETGIIVGGICRAGFVYILGDYSIQGTPKQWAERVAYAYGMHQADAVVYEGNQGGEMVESVIKSVLENVKLLKVHASRGKITRAEPVSALYEQGKVHHVGNFYELEDQMTTYKGVPGDKSPDRMDAMVWAVTQLVSPSSMPMIRSL